ncbi:MAG: pyridoxamine kinase [Spirochaetales bacterium]|nr:pyridoxamine kinase [Spirochaetales bacterium]
MSLGNPVPRVAAIHDISGFGRSSLTIVLPVLSAMGVQASPLPTALLSTQTSGFGDYFFLDLSDEMIKISNHWRKLKINFDAIYTGFLGSSRQVDIVSDFIDDFSSKGQFTVVDPVMGDDGETYGPYGNDMIFAMQELVKKANIITPNFTEACLLLDEKYRTDIKIPLLKDWMRKLSDKGPEKVVFTSVPVSDKSRSFVFAYDRSFDTFWKVSCSYIPAAYPGTGDIFTSVLTGALLQGDSLPIALDRAVQFVSLAIRSTFGYNSPGREGVMFEKVLYSLMTPVTVSNYEIVE